MTRKEMAEQFADNINGFEPTCSLLSAKDKSHAYRLGRYDGFLAGLEAGKPKWHDLRKNPGDLPKKVIEVLNEEGDKVIYTDSCRGWIAYSEYYEDYVGVEVPIAWCEVPKFEG